MTTADKLPGISCICMTYARPQLLEEAIHSFLRQDYTGPKELIVLNDFAPQSLHYEHPEVQVINLPYRFRTVGEKMNAGVGLAKYDLICLWDDDDIVLPHRLSLSAQRVTDHLFNASQAWYWNDGGLSGPAYNTFHAASCYPRSLFDLIGGYPARGNGQDADFERALLRVASHRYERAELPPQQIYYIYRWRGTASYHLSGWGEASGEEESAAYAYRQLEQGQLDQGRIELHPCWRQDYETLVRNNLAESDRSADTLLT
ncbi:MAG: glycosyltransferase family 2 protein [Caldilineaceae bacterium]|nr:glycosyltransferase family 2 protein [Caldilineaceae bacterium]